MFHKPKHDENLDAVVWSLWGNDIFCYLESGLAHTRCSIVTQVDNSFAESWAFFQLYFYSSVIK